MSHNNRIESLELIKQQMRLRAPQREALEKFHEVISTLPTNLSDATYLEVTQAFRKKYPHWTYQSGANSCPELTIDLATGVGKTKFIGSAIAYLFNAKDSRNFLIITPRAEIIRKFVRELQPDSSKYIFTDKSVISQVEIVISDNIESKSSPQFTYGESQTPTVWVFSPQSFTAKGAKIKSAGDFGLPTVGLLKDLKDLVVFFDESHHLGNEASKVSAWKKEIYDLEPRLIIGTTASTSTATKNILYSYSLRKCLEEKLYTKQVQIIPEKLDPTIGEDEQDHIALKYSIQRLEEKEAAILNYVQINETARNPRPVLLVCCNDIQHAKQTFEWLQEHLGNGKFVRLIHSEMKEQDYLPWLLNLEEDHSPVRVIVQVAMLNEGWDVSTVYGICPLRQMNSITMVQQVMGRGLRLPFGHPTGDLMVDELDIFCFGRKGVQDLANEAIASGYGTGSFSIKEGKDATKSIPSIEVNLEHSGQTGHPLLLKFPVIRRKAQSINLADVNIPRITPSEIHGFQITDPQTIRALGGSPQLPSADFLSITSSLVIRKAKYISESRQKSEMTDLITRLLKQSDLFNEYIDLSPEAVAGHIKKYLDSVYSGITPEYNAIAESHIIPLAGVKLIRQSDYEEVSESTINTRSDWTNIQGKRHLYTGWARCLHRAVPFDVYHELTIARCIDRSDEITWWFRNTPAILTIDTPAGRYSPDFAVFLTLGDLNILLEVKGDIYAQGDSSTALIKKRAAELWCNAVSQSSGQSWEYWFLLDSDAEQCSTWSDIENRVDKG